MNAQLQDTIEKVVNIKAPIEKVYECLSNADGLARWFANRIEGTVNPGETVKFVFDGYGECSVYIVEANPYTYFAYRWIPGGDRTITGEVLDQANTLVEFNLVPTESGTRLSLKESGFASLPAEFYAKAIKENSGGWDSELAELVALFEQS